MCQSGEMSQSDAEITAEEAAELLGKSRSQVNRDAAAGRLPVLRKLKGQRGPRLFDRTAIEQLAEERVS